jgi:Fe-S cluster biosynthesis and repair protein YggX
MKYLLLLMTLLISSELSAQKKKKRQMPFPPSPRYDDCFCKESKRFNEKQRLSFYPFNLAKRIEFVSYVSNAFEETEKDDSTHINPKRDKINFILNSKYRKSKINSTVSFPNFEERFIGDSLIINQLTHIFFNLENKKSICTNSCYNPRNTILFYDKNGDLIEYIDICFECLKHTKSYEKLDEQSYWCEQQYWRLQKLFEEVGLKTKSF